MRKGSDNGSECKRGNYILYRILNKMGPVNVIILYAVVYILFLFLSRG